MLQDFETAPITVADALSHPMVMDAGFHADVLITDVDGRGAIIGVRNMTDKNGWIQIDKFLEAFGIIREMGFDLQLEPAQQLHSSNDGEILAVMWMYPIEEANQYWVHTK